MMDAPIPAIAVPGKVEAPVQSEAVQAAATGDDDLMSQPHPHAPVAKGGGSAWKRHIGRAKRTWGKLSGVDLAIVDGDTAELAALLRRHYSLSDAEIDRQIINFLGSKA